MVSILPPDPQIDHGERDRAGLAMLSDKLEKHRENKALKSLSEKWNEKTTSSEMMTDIMDSNVSNESKQLYMSGIGSLMKQRQDQQKQQQQQQLLQMLGIGGEQPQAPDRGEQQVGEPGMQQQMPGIQQGMQQEAPVQQQQPVQQKPQQKTFTTQEIAAATAINPNMGRMMQQQNATVQKERLAEEKTQQKEELQSRKDIAESYKENKEYRQNVIKSYKSNKTDEMILDRMSILNEKDLVSPTKAKLAEYFGVPMSVIGNPESEEFEKLTATMTRSVKDFYGARITQFELETFLKSIPSLMNSKKGRERITEGLKVLGEPKELEYNILQDIRKEYKGRPLPFDLQEEVAERMEGKLDGLSEKFKNIAEDKVSVILPDGKRGRIPKSKIEALKADGGELL